MLGILSGAASSAPLVSLQHTMQIPSEEGLPHFGLHSCYRKIHSQKQSFSKEASMQQKESVRKALGTVEPEDTQKQRGDT